MTPHRGLYLILYSHSLLFDLMNKAFTREENLDDADGFEPTEVPIPRGAKNYLTPAGALRLQEELRDLKYRERPEVTKAVSLAAANGDRSENGDYIYNKKRLREIDRRLGFLSRRLESAEVVDPLLVNSDQVLFGATVRVRDEEDHEKVYSIVGVDEVDVSKGRISWMSPLGSALLKNRAGDSVQFRSPRGLQEIEIVEVCYRELP